MPATGYIQAYGRIYGRSWTTNRIIELVHERDEARQVACEQYTRANRLEQEKTEWWTKATSRTCMV